MLEMALIVERLSAAGGGSTVGQLFMINPIFGGVSISRFGTPAMKSELLPKIISGEINCAHGADRARRRLQYARDTHLRRDVDGNGWRLNGRKIWITGVESAQKLLVVARTARYDGKAKRTHGLSMFLVDTARKGLSFSPIEKLGTNTLSSMQRLFRRRARSTAASWSARSHGGWPELLDVLNTERIVTTAGLVGAAELAIRLGVDYAKERKVFAGKPIAAYQGIQFPLAQHWAEVECARLMNYKAATLFDTGKPYGTEANVAKLLASQAASAGIEQAMQTMGGMGFAKDMHVERLWRDARLFRFAPISEEMILNFIAGQNLGLPRSY